MYYEMIQHNKSPTSCVHGLYFKYSRYFKWRIEKKYLSTDIHHDRQPIEVRRAAPISGMRKKHRSFFFSSNKCYKLKSLI